MAIRFLWNNLANTSTAAYSSSTEDPSFPVENVFTNSDRNREWRTLLNTTTSDTTTAEHFAMVDLGSAMTISAVGVVNRLVEPMQSLGSVLRLQASDTNNFASLTLDVTLTLANNMYVATFAATSRQYWRLFATSITVTTAFGGYLKFGYISLGVPFTPTSSDVSVNWIKKMTDVSTSQRSIGGQLYFDKRDYYRSTDISLDYLSNADHDQLETIYKGVGRHTPFFLMVDDTQLVSDSLAELTYFGRFTEDLNFEYKISDFYNLSFNFEEAL